jgi:hypothetical protein
MMMLMIKLYVIFISCVSAFSFRALSQILYRLCRSSSDKHYINRLQPHRTLTDFGENNYQGNLLRVKEKIQETNGKIEITEAEIIDSEQNAISALNQNDKEYWRSKTLSLRSRASRLRSKVIQLLEEEKLLMLKSVNIVRVPEDVPFSRQIEQCALPPIDHGPNKFVGLFPVVSESLRDIREIMPMSSTDTFRKPPMTMSCMDQGGKTTVLRQLFDELKKPGDVNPVYINFKNNFILYPGETHSEAILRLIAEQLIDSEKLDQPIRIKCSRYHLEKYIVASKRPFVLIIDDLDLLSYPLLEYKSAWLLRVMFLDPPDRYLIYSSRRFMVVDESITNEGEVKQSNARKHILINQPKSFDLKELRSISPSCRDLTLAEAQYYGGIPSLIFYSKESNETT